MDCYESKFHPVLQVENSIIEAMKVAQRYTNFISENIHKDIIQQMREDSDFLAISQFSFEISSKYPIEEESKHRIVKFGEFSMKFPPLELFYTPNEHTHFAQIEIVCGYLITLLNTVFST